MMPPITTVWIHRLEASDILVRFYSNEEAYIFSLNYLTLSDDSTTEFWDCETFGADDSFFVGNSDSSQVSIHRGEFHHLGWSNYETWNTDGTVLVKPMEALDLGEYREPEGFVPGESENSIWQKETRTKEELDQELDDFRRLGEIETLIHFNQLMNSILDPI